MTVLEHEHLLVHEKALTFAAAANALVSDLPPRRKYLMDQLDRASGSIVYNIGEGAGEWRPKEKARLYRIALRSATECASILSLLATLRLASIDDLRAPRELLQEIVRMLVTLCRRVQER